MNPILGVSLLELELLLDESRDNLERVYELEPEHVATGNYFYQNSFKRNATAVKGKFSQEEHLRTPQIIVQESKKRYTVSCNPELEARIEEKLKQFHCREGEDAQNAELLFANRFAKEWSWIKTQQQKIVEYLLQRQEKYLASENIFDLQTVTQSDIAEYIGHHPSTVCYLLRNLTVQLPNGKTLFVKELVPNKYTTVIKGVHALSELQRDEGYFADGQWKFSDIVLRTVLQERYGMNIARRTVTKYKLLLEKEKFDEAEENA